ncbi:dienelactone hydrolase family protein [Mycobacterium sp. SMC-4]|uniref:dienelactone hydrolase family protein n=1 Tax=Mycobacterium sp. SMC-4 TaxID=2857059 RepID=UPI0028C4B073|nr:dienelactone hydrolase family protein [Mycobacterium sp. SMC-4]
MQTRVNGIDEQIFENVYNATEPIARTALQDVGLVHEIIVEPGAHHAFFNDTGDRYDASAAADAWHGSLDWLSGYMA